MLFVRMAPHRFGDTHKLMGNALSGGDNPYDRRYLLPFTMLQFIEKYSGWPDGMRFSLIPLAGDTQEISNARSGHLVNAVVALGRMRSD